MTRFLLDFTRSLNADESSVELPRGDVEYQLRGRGQSRPEIVELRWTDRLIEQLGTLRDHSDGGVGEVAALVGQTLAKFIKVPAWMLAASQVAAQGNRELTSLTFRSNASEIYLLPWELLSIDEVTHAGFLTKLLIRYEWPDKPTAPRLPGLSVTKRGRVVFAWSAAGGKVDAARHVKLIERSLQASRGLFEDARDLGFDEVKNASRESVRAALERAKKAGEPVAVLHLLCHGAARDDGTFGLALDDGEGAGGKDVVSPSRLQQMLLEYAGLVRLVVISACDSGNAGALGQALGSVAQEVHKAGFAAVIASRFPLSWDGARAFAGVLYEKILVELTSLEEAFLAARTALAERATYDWASLQLYAREADGDATYVFNARPYQGLAAFKPEHARFLFGREREIREVVGDLEALVTKKLPRFLVVSGASGTGKSSMVLGGAIPRWKRSADDGGFGCVVVKPGSDPAEALARIDACEDEIASCARFVVVVDQFEEVFTHADTPESAAASTAFVRALWKRACAEGAGVCVLVTLRIDFLARCNEIVLDEAGLRLDKIACDPEHQVLVAQMSPEQLREAIEGPARSAGLALEANLADVIVRDVEAAPGALPLMSHALYRLWAARAGTTLTRAEYENLGAVRGALNAHAEKVLDELAGDDDRAAVRGLMVELVRLGRDGEADTRRRRTLAEVRPEREGARARFDRALARLTEARLLVTGGEGSARTVEVAHEALIRSWGRFKAWIHEERRRLVQIAQIDEWVRDWKENGQILTGRKLAVAEEVAAEYGEHLRADARELLAQSVGERERLQREAERARRAKVRAAAGAFATLTVFLAVAVGLALYARAQERKAEVNELKANREEHEARRARARAERDEITSRAVTLRTRGEEPGHELKNLAEAVELHGDASRRGLLRGEVASYVQGALYQTTVAALYRRALAGHDHYVQAAQFSPDGGRVVTAALDHTAKLWDAHTGALVATLGARASEEAPGDPSLATATFAPDGSRVVTALGGRGAQVWDARAGGLAATLEGHTETVRDARFSPDGSRVVTASDDGTARLWDARSGEAAAGVAVLRGHTGPVARALFTPDGSRVVTASDDGTARLWDARTGRGVCVFRGHAQGLNDARLSPDTRLLATASKDGTAALWDAGTCRRIAVLRGEDAQPQDTENESDDMLRVAFSPDGTRVATTSADRTAVVWSVPRGARLAVCRGHTLSVFDAVFAPDGESLYTASADRTLRRWDARTGAPSVVLAGHTDDILRVSLLNSAEGVRLLTASEDRSARLWSDRAAALAIPLTAHTDSVVDAQFSPDGARVVTASHDGTARLWDATTGALVTTLGGHTGPLNAAVFSPDGALLVTASRDHTALVRDARDGAARFTLRGHTDSVSFAAFSRDGARVVTASKDRSARVWDAHTGALVATLQGHTERVFTAAFSPDASRVVTASEDHTAALWDARTGARVASLTGHAMLVSTAEFSPDGAYVLTASDDRTARVWGARTGALVRTLHGHAAEVPCAHFSPDGSRVVTASLDATARVWDVQTGASVVLQGHATALWSAGFSPDGSRVVTTSLDTTARLWDARTGVGIATLQGHTDEVLKGAFSPDGARVVTVSYDGTARLWNLDPDTVLRAACGVLRSAPFWDSRSSVRDACGALPAAAGRAVRP